MQYCASAPGKIILSGEHSVVYGKTAVAAVVDLRTFVEFNTTPRRRGRSWSASGEGGDGDGNGEDEPPLTLEVRLHEGRRLECAWDADLLARLAAEHPELEGSDPTDLGGSKLDELLAAIRTACVVMPVESPVVSARNQHRSHSLQSPMLRGRVVGRAEGGGRMVAVSEEWDTPYEAVLEVFLIAYLCFLGGGRCNNAPEAAGEAGEAAAGVASSSRGKIPPLHCIVSTELPVGSGLGSSASFSAAVATGFLEARRALVAPQGGEDTTGTIVGAVGTAGAAAGDAGAAAGGVLAASAADGGHVAPGVEEGGCVEGVGVFDKAVVKTLNAWSFQFERVMHGNPSGVDNTTCVHGGVVIYTKTGGPKLMGSLSLGESSGGSGSSGSSGASGASERGGETSGGGEHSGGSGGGGGGAGEGGLRVLVTDTRTSRVTKVLVENVRKLRDAAPAVVNALFDAMDATAKGIAEELVSTASVGGGGGGGEIEEKKGGDGGGKRRKEEAGDTSFDRVSRLVRINQSLLEAIGVSHPNIQAVLTACAPYGLATKLTGAGKS